MIGYRKLISAICGVVGIVLVSYFGVPQVQVDSIMQLLTELIAAAMAFASIVMVVWKQIAVQGDIDKAVDTATGAQRGLDEFKG